MKNREYFFIIYLIFIILSVITIFTLYILGNKTRVGYISIDKKTKIEYFYCDEYNFAIRYYNSIFRNSDIYDVYINTNDIIKNNNFITNINIKDGEPFGIIIVDKMMSNDKIDNINYTLKIKKSFLINIYILNILISFIYLIYNLIKNNKVVFNKNDNYKYNINITYYIFFILLLALFVRIFWAYQQDGIYWDEWHSLNYTNRGLFADNDNINYVGIKGFDILKNLTIDDSSIKDCIYDIVRLYKNTDDPFISNLYYTLLRLSFIGREVVYIKNIIVTGTILNCIFL